MAAWGLMRLAVNMDIVCIYKCFTGKVVNQLLLMQLLD
jgi:hypothetical protein